MVIRSARPVDFPRIVGLARKLSLDYKGMEGDTFWLAEEAGRIVGIIGLKKHPDCRELCALGVDPSYRKKGLGQTLVRTLLSSAARDIYLATVIASYFERCGFEKTASIPRCMKKDPEWCEGCDKELCTVMVRKFR